MTTTRTQHRATCPICFRDHAVVSLEAQKMVQHGYSRPEGWHANVGECAGTNQPHFGTEAGREVARANAGAIRTWAEAQRRAAAEFRTNPPATVQVDGKYLPAERRHERIEVDAADYRYADRLASMIRHLETDARHADQAAAEIEKHVAEWAAVAPRAVEVETGPTLHAVNEYLTNRNRGRPIALCAGLNNNVYKATTTERAKVSCKACLKALAARDADAEESKAADALIAEMVAKYGPETAKSWTDANAKAIKELRYNRKEIAKNIRKRATDRLERGVQ